MTPTETALRAKLTDHLLRQVMLHVWTEDEEKARDVLVAALTPPQTLNPEGALKHSPLLEVALTPRADAAYMFRAGDTVKHRPSGETWVLACDQEGNDVMPAGWPESMARASDCELLEIASDAERLAMLQQAQGGDGVRGSIARRQLRAAPPPPPEGLATLDNEKLFSLIIDSMSATVSRDVRQTAAWAVYEAMRPLVPHAPTPAERG